MSKQLRLLYAAGPGDVIGTYNHWAKGQDDPSQVAITYSGQFYNVCRELDAQGYIISLHKDKKFLRDGRFTFENRPNPLDKASGLLYHLGLLLYGLRLIATAVAWRADAAIVAEGTTHWFVLSLLPWFGVKVIPTIHCALWRKFVPQRKAEKLALKLSRHFFSNGCTAILAIADEVSKQLTQLTHGLNQPIVQFIPTYRRTEFAQVNVPSHNRSPFRVLFVGRIEENKGVFELLEMAKHFAELGRQDIHFDICGTGSALESLRLAAKEAGLDSSFVCHGYCNKPQMHERLNQAHVVIVPTRIDFIEGFNKVVVEGVLAGRPVVTSAVCPALSYVRDAVVEVPPDDIKAYSDALLKLCDNRKLYEQKRQSCIGLQEQFYDRSHSWESRLKYILAKFIKIENSPKVSGSSPVLLVGGESATRRRG